MDILSYMLIGASCLYVLSPLFSRRKTISGKKQAAVKDGADQGKHKTNCTSCGNPVEPGALYCSRCGTKLGKQN